MVNTADTFSTSGQTERGLTARMNRLPVITRVHRGWLALLAALMVFEGADLNSFAYAAVAIRHQWGLSIADIGLLTSAAFLGMIIGAAGGGWLADRCGRKWTIIGSTLFYSAFSLASAGSHGIVDLTIYRVLTGAGLLAMVTVLVTYVAEMFPRPVRGRALAIITGVGLLGVPMMAWFSRLVTPLGPSEWRWIFVLGAAGAVVAVASIWLLPESVRWLDANGRRRQAVALVERLEAEATQATGRELPAAEEEPAVAPARMIELFRGRLIKRTVVTSVMLIFLALGFYGFQAWVPTLLVAQGFSAQLSLTYTSILALAAAPGALLAWTFIDRWERKWALCAVELLVAVFMLVFGLTTSKGILLASGVLVTLFLQTGTVFVYTYLPEIFPTRLRGTGTGFANGMGRVSGFASGFLVAAIFAGFGFSAVFVVAATAMALMGLVVGLFGERTTNRSLEHIAETTGKPAKKIT